MIVILTLGAIVATAAGLLAVATRSRDVQLLDDRLEALAGRHRTVLHRYASIGTLPGERWLHPAMGALASVVVWALRPEGNALRYLGPLAGASLGAIIAHHAIKFVYRRPRPAVALAKGKTEPAYPSGHTADATAVLLTAAWILAREGLLPAAVAAPIAVALALATGASRVALGWHWGSDVIGGWLTGAAVAAACVAWYEALVRAPVP